MEIWLRGTACARQLDGCGINWYFPPCSAMRVDPVRSSVGGAARGDCDRVHGSIGNPKAKIGNRFGA